MRMRGNSAEHCAAAAAADPDCGSFINYNKAWHAMGACHCVDRSNLDCKERQFNLGYTVYRVSCPPPQATSPETTAAPAPVTSPAPAPPTATSPPTTPSTTAAAAGATAGSTTPSKAEGETPEPKGADNSTHALTAEEKGKKAVRVGGECYFQYNGGAPDKGKSSCFCQLAGNLGCQGKSCSCKQGCEVRWRNTDTVSFPNIKKAYGCLKGKETSRTRHPSAVRPARPVEEPALLTIPNSYISDLNVLKDKCLQGMLPLLASMLRDGFTTYQQHIGTGPVMQCVHSAEHVSISWLHLHTFCPYGSVDGMPLSPPQNNRIAYCEVMESIAEAEELAARIAKWSGVAQDALPTPVRDYGTVALRASHLEAHVRALPASR